MTLREALTVAAAMLANDEHLHGTATRDAELLLLHVLQISRTTLIAHPGRELTPSQRTTYEATIARRLHHEPIQYITGRQEFYGVANQTLKIADIGTGSGAIAIALAIHLPQAEITALDISTEALAVAATNARRHDVASRIQFLQSDLLAALNHEPQTFDAIVSNPPYIPSTDRATLHPQVRDHEPPTALFAGEDGLDIYKRLITQAWSALKPNGLLALEIGHGQQADLITLLTDWHNICFINDLQQIPRVALARTPAAPAIR